MSEYNDQENNEQEQKNQESGTPEETTSEETQETPQYNDTDNPSPELRKKWENGQDKPRSRNLIGQYSNQPKWVYQTVMVALVFVMMGATLIGVTMAERPAHVTNIDGQVVEVLPTEDGNYVTRTGETIGANQVEQKNVRFVEQNFKLHELFLAVGAFAFLTYLLYNLPGVRHNDFSAQATPAYYLVPMCAAVVAAAWAYAKYVCMTFVTPDFGFLVTFVPIAPIGCLMILQKSRNTATMSLTTSVVLGHCYHIVSLFPKFNTFIG